MKFSCERCGKKYATAENPAPGRVYKLKCKACGHLIVVKAAGTTARPAPTPPPTPPPDSSAAASLEGAAPGLVGPPSPDAPPPPEIALEIAPPEPERRPANGSRSPAMLDATTEISMPTPSLTPPPFPPLPADLTPPPLPEPPAEPERAEKPPSPEAGYVDLFADTGSSGVAALPKTDDPFLAAARASLPDNYGSGVPGAPDPFAPLREELSEAASRTPEPVHTPAPAVPKVPVIPKPPAQKTGLPIALIGGGVAVLVGILAFVLISSGKKAPPPPAPPPARVAQAPAPPAPPPVVPAAQEPPAAAPAPVAEAARAEAKPAEAKPAEAKPAAEPKRVADDQRRAREEKRRKDREEAKQREAEARAQKEARAREARDAKERERADRERRAAEDRAARDRERAERQRREAERVASESMPAEAEGGLTQAQIERVLQSTKKAFDGCIQSAQGSDVKLDGRRVMLRLNIQTSGAVTYPTLDDVTLNSTDVGSCLKSAARLMVFPKFKGDTMHVEVPLVMR